jgi:hypothetical protein
MITTKMGVNELRILASELSIFFAIAVAYKNAGNKLPVTPVMIIMGIFLQLTFRTWTMENGRRTTPAEKILSAPICGPDNCSLLCFIRINELPQIMLSNRKRIQLISLCLVIPTIANVLNQMTQDRFF